MPSPVCPVAGVAYTDSNGVPRHSAQSAQRAGPNGPLLLQDFHLIDLLTHQNRERIPERVVHAKGSGAHGVFEATEDNSDLCMADFLQKGTKSPCVARFSTVGGESGSSDTARDPRGFSLKVKTSEGNWDFVGNNTPIFFLRDPAKFPIFIHTQKRNPQTNSKDKDAFWDYLSQNPESVHQVLHLFSDRGTPASYRHMHGYSGHTFKMVNKNGDWNYVQIHMRTDQGVKTHTNEEASKLDASNPDSNGDDLFDAIKNGDFPSWTVQVQVMSPEQAQKFRYNILDLTKVWSHKEFPLRTIGKFTLNRNVDNYFAEVEQLAFAPSHLPPGIEPSNDPVLQARLFSYPDAHRYRLGINYNELPVNCPVASVSNYLRSGAYTFNANGGAAPNYPSSLNPLKMANKPYTRESISDAFDGPGVVSFESGSEELDFEQPRALWSKVFDDEAKDHFVSNVCGHLGGVTYPYILQRQIEIFRKVDPSLGDRIEKTLREAGVKLETDKEAEPKSNAEINTNGELKTNGQVGVTA
ncbi:catalase [Phaffia rhodozyma]|uniref:Catalase n=1 Tax=Phaffia rhodozyma TaxID=264483 RepID=A0A0F7SYD4_PHARH|nr:catalase [Phaffia rhodozyma]